MAVTLVICRTKDFITGLWLLLWNWRQGTESTSLMLIGTIFIVLGAIVVIINSIEVWLKVY